MLQHPIENFKWDKNISQLFGVNKSLYSDNFGIPAHNGLDYVIPDDKKNGYGYKVLATHDGVVSRLNYETKWRTNGNGVYLISEDGSFETIYWHLSEILVTIGQKVKAGDVIGLMGNTGFCNPIPTKEKPYNGTHLHFAVFKKDKPNEYNGCIDPTPMLYKEGDRLPIYFAKDLFFGCYGDDVSWLQTLLKIELGDKVDFEPLGYFGNKTRIAVGEFQKKYGIDPTLGYCGIKTRAILMQKYSIYYKR